MSLIEHIFFTFYDVIFSLVLKQFWMLLSLSLILLSNYGAAYEGAVMGKLSTCDDAKTGLSTDWDERDFTQFTCPNEYSFPVQANVDPIHFEITSLNASFDPKTDVVSHKCMSDSIEYHDIPPVRGDHRPNWARYGEYLYLPVQRWMHNLEHGTIVLLYHPCVDQKELSKLREIVTSCLYRHIITPYKKLNDRLPLALVAWGAKLEMNQVNSQQVVDFIKMHARVAPEDLFKDGLYDRYLIRPAVKVNDDMDNNLCSHNNL